MLGTVLVVILILALLGALPRWSHSRQWGYVPSGTVGLVLGRRCRPAAHWAHLKMFTTGVARANHGVELKSPVDCKGQFSSFTAVYDCRIGGK